MIEKFEDLVGKTIASITNGDDRLIFDVEGEGAYIMWHHDDCCESVTIDDIAGDLNDLIGSPVVRAEESSNSDDPPRDGYAESHTWTFYRIATAKGLVVIRWYGSSNGYYSESVSWEKA